LSSHHHVQTGSGALPAYYPMVGGGFYSWNKPARRDYFKCQNKQAFTKLPLS
jgi:hypothetical protein